MDLEERTYSVMVVSQEGRLDDALEGLFPQGRYTPVTYVPSISAAKRSWASREFDFVIVNAPLPDDMGIRFAIDVSRSATAVVLLLVRSDIYGETAAKVSGSGVYTLPKPVSRPLIALALAWMAATRERLRTLERKTVSIEEKMAEIRLVNRAKWVLISQCGMDEPDAHRFIEKQAMDRCVPKSQVAREIIADTV